MVLKNFFKGLFAKRHVKLGLALGSGGAKGAAHVGVLKAFEEEGIKFDIVAGTSIGSVIGALLATGLNSEDMARMMKEYGIADPVRFLGYKFKGRTVEQAMDVLLSEKTFLDADIPFAAVAADLDTGEQVVMKSGSLATAVAASSAIPPAFKPVVRMNRRLVDGAFVNAVPADVVKKMGADVVISVNLTSVATNAVGKATLDVMYKGHGIKEQNRLLQMKEFSDYVLSPDLAGFKSVDVTKTDEMFDRGYACAKQNMYEIKNLLTSKKVKF